MRKRHTVTLGVAVAALLCAAPQLGAVEKFAVDGVDVILKTNSANEIVAAQFYLKGGVAQTGADRAGIEAALFRVATEGTTNYPKARLRSELSRMGTQIGNNITHDFSALNMLCLKRYLDDSWKIFADIITHPLCDREEVTLVKERMTNDIHQTEADPDGYARKLGDALFYRGHPYAVSPTGTEETVAGLSSEKLLAYHGTNVSKSRALVVIVGDVDKATATRLVRDGLGGLPTGSYMPSRLPTPGGKSSVEHKFEARELPTNYVRAYFPAPPVSNIDDAVPMFVGMEILRDRLFEEVRTKRNLTYAVSSAMSTRKDNYGLLYVTSVDPATAFSVMLDEVDRIKNDGIPAKDLSDKIKVLTTETLMGESTNAGQATGLAMAEINGEDYTLSAKRIDMIQKVTATDIQRVVKEYCNNVNCVVLGDVDKGQEMVDAVAAR